MNYENYLKDLFESLEDYRKIIFLIFLIQNDKKLKREIGFSKKNINRSILKFKNILVDQHEEYVDYIKNEEESAIEKFLNKSVENDINYQSLQLSISLK